MKTQPFSAAILIGSALMLAAPQEKAQKKQRDPMFELTSANAKYRIRFSEPAWPGRTQPGSPWQKIEAWTAADGWRVVEDFTGEAEGALPYSPAGDRWSPDGRYFVVVTVQLNKALVPDDIGAIVYLFLDLGEADSVSFISKTNIALTSNFLRWKPGEPHTMLIRGDRPGTIDEVHPNTEEQP